MKTIKKVTAFLLSMVLLFSFVTTYVCAIEVTDRCYYYFHPLDDRLTANFHQYEVEIPSYAEAYCTAYYAEDCDLGVKTLAHNPQLGTIDDIQFANAGYVELYVEFESGISGSMVDYVKCDEGAESATVRIFGVDVVEHEFDDTVVYFKSTHKILTGIRMYHPSNDEKYDQEIGTEIITISLLN